MSSFPEELSESIEKAKQKKLKENQAYSLIKKNLEEYPEKQENFTF